MEAKLEKVDSPHVLRDYAFLADGVRGALIDPDGELAWMSFPTWSDPAVFAGLLGSGGSYRVHPKERRVHGGTYEDGTLIWRSRWVTARGIVEARDALAYPGDEGRAVILRRVTALDHAAEVEVALSLMTDYGRQSLGDWQRQEDLWVQSGHGISARWRGAERARPVTTGSGGHALVLDIPLERGESHDLVLELQHGAFGDDAPLPADELWRRTEAAWADAVPSCDGVPAGRDVRRSFAVLRGMTNSRGVTVAAATTSLPERAEAGRNYDYRYAWVRDTCYIGHAGAAVKGGDPILDDAVRWVTERVLSDGPHTMPGYQVNGAPIPDERTLGLPGYPGGFDVIGNKVRHQFQLDMFGEALLLFANAASHDRLEADGWRAVEITLDAIGQRNGEKEAGIWEVGPKHWTHSRLICIAGLRAMAEAGAPKRWTSRALTLADHLMSATDRSSLHHSGRWQRAPDDDRVDASWLLAEMRGALRPDDPRSVATREAIMVDLCQDDYLYRYPHPGQPLGEAEGAFLVCNFWMALACIGSGDVTRGAQWFERTRASCSASGLFSEEFDVEQRQLRGNLPQAFVHALLIECAATLENA
jgi:GH15 family glucan-1,4-alpha-glucosidase